jgi:hypothetical protein
LRIEDDGIGEREHPLHALVGVEVQNDLKQTF